MILVLLALSAWAGTLQGRVITEFGEPQAGVYVAAYNANLRQVGVDGPTGPDGRYAVEVPEGRIRLRFVPADDVNRVEAWAPGGTRDVCAATVFDVPASGALPVDDVALFAGLALHGTLITADGQGIAEAELEANPRRGGATIATREATSAADGSFSIVGLPEDTSWVVRVRAPDLPRQYIGGSYEIAGATELTGLAGETVELPPATLLSGISVQGQATGPDGPLAGAAVSVYSEGQIRSVRTQEDGTYQVVGLPPGEVTAWVDAEEHARVYWPDSVLPADRLPVQDEGSEVTGFDLQAPYESIVHGQLTGVADLEGINVLLVHESGTLGLGASTEADGSFVIEQVPPGTWNLNLRGEEQGVVTGLVGGAEDPIAWPIGVAETVSLQAQVEPAVTFEGIITGPDGRPATDALVTLRSRDTDVRYETYVLSDGSYLFGGLRGGDTWDLWAEGDPPCPVDPDRVRIYYDDTPDPYMRIGLARSAGDRVAWSAVLPDDRDRDAMDDVWEEANGLVVGAVDTNDDPDGDGLSNLIEYWEGRDPLTAEKAGCGALPVREGVGGLVLILVAGLGRRRLRSRQGREERE